MIAVKRPADKILGQYGFALAFQLSRERSKKTEAVFLVGSRESEGKSKSPQALFLLPAFSFGEAKENAELQLQICTMYQLFSSFSETSKASPMRGSCRRRRLMRWTAPRRRKCLHLIRHGFAVPPSPHRGRLWCSKNRKSSRKKVQPDKFRLHLLFTADILRQLLTNLMSRIRRRVPRRP